MKALFYRPIQLVALAFIVLLLLALIILGGLTWRDQRRLQSIHQSVDYTHAIQRISLDLQDILLEELARTAAVNREQLLRMDAEVAKLSTASGALVRDTSKQLAEVRLLLTDPQQPPRISLAKAIELMRHIVYDEIEAVSRLLVATDHDAKAEFQLVTATILVLPGLLALAIWLLRQRIFNPINNLSELLSRLAKSEFTPVPLRHVDPLLLPLLDNYNQMVIRLEELEQAHRSHTTSLEAEVRSATQTLLQQHHNLARAERLAAVGELSAKLAHELRNPLAGIQLTLANLRDDLREQSLVERVDLVLAELARITLLLNNLLTRARHVPESPRLVKLARVVNELLTLMRYQAPAAITLEARIPDDLHCLLQEGQLRQALLNLVLNALQVLEGKAGTITVSAEKRAATLHLSVCDNGPGFPAALLSANIRTFVSGRGSGTGLGLAMVQRFAREIGGKLELTNRRSGGACASLVLPCGEGDG